MNEGNSIVPILATIIGAFSGGILTILMPHISIDLLLGAILAIIGLMFVSIDKIAKSLKKDNHLTE